ncbi:hypothetical protein FGO68_gene655 [Halteria grandinella]|uniref:Uncharacterized protein n=1 Tax=Halteria grandinella TaxID=5974 RepID=A0A8J8NT10_HALGN|nr:hypothetical protein FGO68_gene655 [Halteria grandinella]
MLFQPREKPQIMDQKRKQTLLKGIQTILALSPSRKKQLTSGQNATAFPSPRHSIQVTKEASKLAIFHQYIVPETAKVRSSQNEKDSENARQKSLKSHRASRLGKEAMLGEALAQTLGKNKKSGFDPQMLMPPGQMNLLQINVEPLSSSPRGPLRQQTMKNGANETGYAGNDSYRIKNDLEQASARGNRRASHQLNQEKAKQQLQQIQKMIALGLQGQGMQVNHEKFPFHQVQKREKQSEGNGGGSPSGNGIKAIGNRTNKTDKTEKSEESRWVSKNGSARFESVIKQEGDSISRQGRSGASRPICLGSTDCMLADCSCQNKDGKKTYSRTQKESSSPFKRKSTTRKKKSSQKVGKQSEVDKDFCDEDVGSQSRPDLDNDKFERELWRKPDCPQQNQEQQYGAAGSLGLQISGIVATERESSMAINPQQLKTSTIIQRFQSFNLESSRGMRRLNKPQESRILLA